MSEMHRPDPNNVFKRLKDFQRDSVEYVFSRMYDEQHAAKRFLIADEVGLGKTLVAQGLIAKTIDKLWDSVGRIDVVYVCSNSDIARQNINRLRLKGCGDFQLATRLTLLPTLIRDLKKRKVNFVSFTPGTSFDLRSSTGIMRERLLLFWLLRKRWRLEGTGPLNVLQAGASRRVFRNAVREFPQKNTVDRHLAKAFRNAIRAEDRRLRGDGKPSLRRRFMALCKQLGYNRSLTKDEGRERASIVGELRSLLAATCIKALEPDLVILDEFQRFKHLLREDGPAGQLARHLFDADTDPRVLLLSATPYKMYTLSQERLDDDHYADFLSTLEFLIPDKDDFGRFGQLLGDYRRQLYRLAEDGHAALVPIKEELQQRLRRVMVRTERLAVTQDRNGMLRKMASPSVKMTGSDVATYVGLQAVSNVLDTGDVVEYWKSSPYLLNFMEDYELKRELRDPSSGTAVELAAALQSNSHLLLPWKEIERYRRLDPNNARLRGLLADTVGCGAWRLLWLPPAFPYYQLDGAFSDPQLRTFTKRLVFSSWQVVPKAIATMLSYEAERQMITSLEPEAVNTATARKRRRALLTFARSQGRLTGMPVLGMLYPSIYLASQFDPLKASGCACSPTIAEAVGVVQAAIEKELSSLTKNAERSDRPDESWYWAAPILLDLKHFPDAARNWLGDEQVDVFWSGQVNRGGSTEGGEEEVNGVTAEDAGGDGDSSRWVDHVREAQRLVRGKTTMGQPPKDLSLVLAQMAVAGPAVTALRALLRVLRPEATEATLMTRDYAGQIAWAIRSLFNIPEVMSLVRGMNKEEPYWRRVLEYCLSGCLQATLDEYVHMIWETSGLASADLLDATRQLGEALCSAISLRVATPGVDHVAVTGDGISIDNRTLRARFAMRFGNERSEDGREHRADQVRQAFNSPFWPFVLATTSVGQEGLDFHTYCHAVVHWNLPSNPVDLEQREGRVHRYKGHAVRKNIASRYGQTFPDADISDPWAWMFDQARLEPGRLSDLSPYWVYPLEGGAAIERHVPVLPLSREWDRLPALLDSLAVYRMVFGQPRQEDLLNYLLSRVPKERLVQEMDGLRIDLSPPKSAAGQA